MSRGKHDRYVKGVTHCQELCSVLAGLIHILQCSLQLLQCLPLLQQLLLGLSLDFPSRHGPAGYINSILAGNY